MECVAASVRAVVAMVRCSVFVCCRIGVAMRTRIADSIRTRLRDEVSCKNPVSFLTEHNVEAYLDTLVATVYLYTRPKRGTQNTALFFSEIVVAIGNSVRNTLKLQKDSRLSAKVGGFLLYTFEELGLLTVKLGAGPKGHNQYTVHLLNDDAICELWAGLTTGVVKLPALEPYASWTSARHSTGASLVKTGNRDVLRELTPETHPLVFETVNRAQKVGWRINSAIYTVYTWALKNKTDAFSEIWEMHNPEARRTKLREAKAIGDIAKRLLGHVFYHLYYLDFRGRKYPTTAYLHEQGSDSARGLLLRDDRKPIGKDGFYWLLVAIASTFAGPSGRVDGVKTDKIPLRERAIWTLANEEQLLGYAEEPRTNQGWMQADKPWQFLAACTELMNFRIWQYNHNGRFDSYDYPSSLEVFIDGSNNGSQHLAALTRDEETAPHVNLVPSELPGDLYKYVADFIWARLEKRVNQYPPGVRADCEQYIDTVISLKKKVVEAEKESAERGKAIEALRQLRGQNQELAALSSIVFWCRITDNKQRRKIVKRNVMTLPYGGTSYGLGEQQIDDAKKHGIQLLYYLEHSWGAFMGREVYDSCRVLLSKPMKLLSVFEEAGKAAEKESRFLSWRVPITDFPVVQNYTEGTVKKVYVQYGPPKGARLSTGYYENTFQINVSIQELPVPARGKQSQGASPNAIHSLDAAHLMMTVASCDFPVTTIHDSFGSLLADMPVLFKRVREQFVKLHTENPLETLLNDVGGDVSKVDFGSLDINLVIESEYCFS